MMRDIGKNIKELRLRAGLSQDELAERLFVTRQTVSNYENSRTRPDVEQILHLAEIFGTDANAVLYGHGACNVPLPNSPRRYSLRLLEALDVGRDRLDAGSAFIAGLLHQAAENGMGAPGAAHLSGYCFWRYFAFRHRLPSGFQYCLPCAPPFAKAFQPCAVFQP